EESMLAPAPDSRRLSISSAHKTRALHTLPHMATATKNTSNVSKRKQKKEAARGGKKPKRAETADRHDLYQRAVQSVDDEVAFIGARFKEIRGRDLILIREDFCGTASMACAWVDSAPKRRAIGVDIDPEVLGWGREHNVGKLDADA